MAAPSALLLLLAVTAHTTVAVQGSRSLLQAAAAGPVSAVAQLPLPLAKVHSHNDYDQPRPLFAALEAGICSIEADPWLINGTFYIAHEANVIKKNLTIQSLYLHPLSQIVKANGGYVYPASKYSGVCSSIILLVDFKSTAYFLPNGTGAANNATNSTGADMWDLFEPLLASYQNQVPGLFTTYNANGTKVPGAITVLISGTRPDPAYVANKPVRYSALDGRLVNLDNAWGPEDRIIRFWNTPDTPDAWEFFYATGEDLVNTDLLQPTKTFTLAKLAGSKSAVAGVPGVQTA
ncbi:hypothetical protein WJX72_002840 [[Myrmecia] bisecta]|uniref:Altered inheritance of mitochondria protein 6 n=1 Tax=[Myrmecia] bisecta TaxID=41462 RepID=A0AAW1PWH7_9CHLO